LSGLVSIVWIVSNSEQIGEKLNNISTFRSRPKKKLIQWLITNFNAETTGQCIFTLITFIWETPSKLSSVIYHPVWMHQYFIPNFRSHNMASNSITKRKKAWRFSTVQDQNYGSLESKFSALPSQACHYLICTSAKMNSSYQNGMHYINVNLFVTNWIKSPQFKKYIS
jgi:hypothetical protein